MNLDLLPASSFHEIWKDIYSEEELNQLEEEFGSLFDTNNLLEAQKKDILFLKDFLQAANGILDLYGQGKVDRVLVEESYNVILDTLSRLARRFHPLTTYGKSYLKQLFSIRKKFEEQIGLLYTIVDKDNIDTFSPLMTKDLAEEVRIGKTKGIGAIRSDKEASYGVGILLYRLENDAKNSAPTFRITWLYVHENWQNQGIANALIGEIVNIMSSSDISALIADIPECEDAMIVGSFLSLWHFKFLAKVTTDFIGQLDDIDMSKLKKIPSHAKRLSEISQEEALSLVNHSFLDSNYQGFLLGHKNSLDLYDTDLSCFTIENQILRSMALVHFYPSGLLSVEYLFLAKGDEKDFSDLISTIIINAHEKYPSSTYVRISTRSKAQADLLDLIFTKQKTLLLLEGGLLPLPEGVDVKNETIKELMSSEDINDVI